MRIFLALFLLLPLCLDAKMCVSNYYCRDSVPRSRSDNIPQTHIAGVDNDYLTGYVQALVDMHYYEFQVRVISVDSTVYVFNLPRNELMSQSIMCFIYDIPCIQNVEKVCCSPQEFLCYLEKCNSSCAEQVGGSSAYCSMLQGPAPGCGVRGVWFPQNTVLFQPLIADPRQVMNSGALRFNDNVVGKHVGAVIFGGDFIFFRFLDVLRWHGDMDLGIQGGIFSVFDLDHPEACMVNTDFFVAAMPTYAINKWSWRFRLWHMSSHVGDEFLISNPGFDRRNVSDNGIDIFASYQLNPAVRFYLGIGDIIWRDREFFTHPLYFEGGTEIRVFGCRDCFNKLYVQPFLAMNFRAWEEHDFDIDQTYALGVEWSKLQYVGQKFRVFFEFHNGYSREGQFVRNRSNYLAIKGAFGF